MAGRTTAGDPGWPEMEHSIGFRADHYDISVAGELASALNLSYTTGAILARRGHRDEDTAREFLAGRERHDPDEFTGIEVAADLVLAAIAAGRRITVYGDFDADGVCATAILVGAFRELGGRCDWFIPDRIDGYGLNPDAIRLLADRGTGVLVTVDCGVTADTEVSLARELGMEVVITDHHRPDPGNLPDCPIVHPEVSGYPFPLLCGAAVAAKFASRLRRSGDGDPAADERDLDLVALATVADVMPLTGENRRLVREGIEVARRARRPGMAALLDECRVAPPQLSSEDFAFRLAPRINAAGRMYRADAGVELFLTGETSRAVEIARELSGANAERRRVEREVLAEAEKAIAARPDPGPVLVVAGEGWHPGVVGIVASRLVRTHGRPSVVIALDGDRGKGSARSVPGLNLHEALGDTSGELLGFGGHAAAAGLTISADRVDSFREALGAAVTARIGPDPVPDELTFDAVAGGEDLGLPLAEELQGLAPFGNGNPGVRLLIPGARISDLSEIGDGKHCRFTINSGSCRAAGVCFGRNSLGAGEDDRIDLLAELGLNHWNQTVTPQVIVRETRTLPAAAPLAGCGPAEWWRRFDEALAGTLSEWEPPAAGRVPSGPAAQRTLVSWSGLPGVRIGELISSGAGVAIVTADAARRWRALGGSDGLGRFNPGAPVLGLWEGSPGELLQGAAGAKILLTDHETLGRLDPGVLETFPETVMLDPPGDPHELDRVLAGTGRLHDVSGPDEYRFAAAAAGHRFDLTDDLRALYRAIRDAEPAAEGTGLPDEKAREVLGGDPVLPRSPERAALLVRVLRQSGVLREDDTGTVRMPGVVSSGKVELTRSAVFSAGITLFKERTEFLKRLQSAS